MTSVKYFHRKGDPRPYPAISSDLRDAEGLDLLSMVAGDWLQHRDYASVGKFREFLRKGEPWSIWLEVIYFDGDEHGVRLALSPHRMEELGDYVTLTVSQFSQILEDFHQFVEDGIEFEREY